MVELTSIRSVLKPYYVLPQVGQLSVHVEGTRTSRFQMSHLHNAQMAR